MIQPWLQQSGKIPDFLLTTESDKDKLQAKKLYKKHSSLQVPLIPVKQQSKTFQKRQSRYLPKMDVGQYKIKNHSLSPKRRQQTPNSHRHSMKKIDTLLPSVSRQLAIYRKIFMMERTTQQRIVCSSRIRQVVKKQQLKQYGLV